MVEKARSIGGETRREVMSLLLKLGPVTAADLGHHLGLSAAGVRRHLDKLEDEQLAETCEPNPVAGEEATRGRPAKHYRLTQQGRDLFGSHYDTLATDAIRVLKDLGGEEAVRSLARERIHTILDGVGSVEDAGGDVEKVAHDLADALDESGYAATVTRAGTGIQICQHHCPVSAVAAEHPEICDAEHEAISALVGRHVQPLALIADGNGICTTNIPLTAAARPDAGTVAAHEKNTERSGDLD
ncbi:Predicted transcriptional regulator, ArsR family [Corynebacterium mycetoides]|uniref:Predicted transcriptional regulator, ArsR family n=1 Tax=Corynebacterium mycetoides TaxID=38302 RepID=A0A1G9MFG7_9CORY|nr:metalloregulator ArsR/SmtB family transcription factor [Corynebacterium mycetoides]SDL72741.1 Predicted transcriptional regulator, ArsR family [Corynebacterium mycetoides]